MFLQMPLDIIMDDLRHTHSLEVTIDNILQGNIAVPSVSTPTKKKDEQGFSVYEIRLLMLFRCLLSVEWKQDHDKLLEISDEFCQLLHS